MPSTRRSHAGIQRVLCIVDPTLTGEGGHSLAYNLLLARVAKSFEVVEIFADRTFHTQQHANVHGSLNLLRLHNLKARLSPFLKKRRPAQAFEPVSLDFRFSAEDCWEPVKIPFVAVKRLRAADLSWSVYRLLSARYTRVKELHMVFQNTGMEELFCLEMLRSFLHARAHTLTFHLVFRHLPERTCSRVLSMERLGRLLQKQSALPYIRTYADTEELSAAFKSIADVSGQFQTLPVPSLIEKRPSDKNSETFRLGMLGPPRMEKGFGCLPALLGVLPAKVKGERRLELVVQTEAGEAASETRAVTASLEEHAKRAAADPEALKLHLLPGPLNAGTYAACFAGLDCVLALHSSPKYAASSSGIFVEALHLGIPSIVFAGTWMGKRISQAAAKGLSIGLCVETLGEVPAAVERIAAEQAVFSNAIAKYLLYDGWRFEPELLAETMFGLSPSMTESKSGAGVC